MKPPVESDLIVRVIPNNKFDDHLGGPEVCEIKREGSHFFFLSL
jgi:hypothetical protein